MSIVNTGITRIAAYDALKVIALVTMFIDHATVIFLPEGTTTYFIGRGIGRLAFPLFAYLLTVGFRYTTSPLKYLSKLVVLAVVSEPIFDLAFEGKLFYPSWQNIFWLLALGLTALWLARKIADTMLTKHRRKNKVSFADYSIRLLPVVVLSIAAGFIAHHLGFDYGAYGIALIAAFYIFPIRVPGKSSDEVVSLAILSLITFAVNNVGFVSVLLIRMLGENQVEHRVPKWFTYGFYPAHLFILWCLSLLV